MKKFSKLLVLPLLTVGFLSSCNGGSTVVEQTEAQKCLNTINYGSYATSGVIYDSPLISNVPVYPNCTITYKVNTSASQYLAVSSDNATLKVTTPDVKDIDNEDHVDLTNALTATVKDKEGNEATANYNIKVLATENKVEISELKSLNADGTPKYVGTTATIIGTISFGSGGSYVITDESGENSFYAYSTGNKKIGVGDRVLVKGEVALYNGSLQFNKNATTSLINDGDSFDYSVVTKEFKSTTALEASDGWNLYKVNAKVKVDLPDQATITELMSVNKYGGFGKHSGLLTFADDETKDISIYNDSYNTDPAEVYKALIGKKAGDSVSFVAPVQRYQKDNDATKKASASVYFLTGLEIK